MTTHGLNISAINHIGIVVADIERAVEEYWDEFGIGPWQIFTFGPSAKRTTVRGEPCAFSLRIAKAQVGAIAIELIQPLDGPTPHQEFLYQRGQGVQHLGVVVEDLERAVEQMARLGFDELTSAYGMGVDGDGGAVYFDTQSVLGTTLELCDPPKRRYPPETVYPPSGA
ncbi:MAG: VOC family protein [Chloroflexi bacterium]|nr:VOC family protein [Chloroflexota bacterium]